MWCLAKLDLEYIACMAGVPGDRSSSLGWMEDVLNIYEKPLSEHQPVVCVDEKPVVLHEDTRPPIPMQPGQIGRRDHEYKRCGTANVFCGIEPKVGVHFTKLTPRRSSPVQPVSRPALQFTDKLLVLPLYLLRIALEWP